jgi:hypothetical protein
MREGVRSVMKMLLKILGILGTTLLILISVYAYREFKAPKSGKIQSKIESHFKSLDQKRFLSDSAYRLSYEREMDRMKLHLAQTYNDEGRPVLAVELLQGLIREESRPMAFPDPSRIEAQIGYYRELERAYRLLGDASGAAVALDQVRLLSETKEILLRQEKQAEEMRKRHSPPSP